MVRANLVPRGHYQVFAPRVPKWFVCNDAPPLSLVRETLIDIAQSCGGCPIVHGHHVARGCVGACYCGVVPVDKCCFLMFLSKSWNMNFKCIIYVKLEVCFVILMPANAFPSQLKNNDHCIPFETCNCYLSYVVIVPTISVLNWRNSNWGFA